MSRPRIFTDAKCAELCAWFHQLRAMGSVRARAKAEGVSERALREAIARHQRAAADACSTGNTPQSAETTSEPVCEASVDATNR